MRAQSNTSPPRIALFSDDPDWHARQLTGSLTARGAETLWLSFADCAFDLDLMAQSGSAGLCLPGFEGQLPDAVLVRLIDPGTLEQITLRLGLLHALRALGVPVYNDARAIEHTVDKSMTSFLIRHAGLPTPPTWVCESPDAAQKVASHELEKGNKLVLKPLFGAQGKGLRLIEQNSDLPPPEEIEGVYYLQRFINSALDNGDCHDWRVLVIGGKAVAAMLRRGKGWITNVWQGARCESVSTDSELSRLAVAAAKALGADYAGVDIIRDPENGLQILEVNSVPAWKGLQEVTDFNIADVLVEDFLSKIPAANILRPAV